MNTTQRHRRLGVLVCFLVFAASCTKDVPSLLYPKEPAISLIELSSTDLVEFSDTLFVRFRYEDGDGDLGGLDGPSKLFVLDQRLSEPDVFSLEELTPNGQTLAIAGEMNVALGPYFKLGNSTEELFAIELWIVDRAGNESNRLITEDLTIR